MDSPSQDIQFLTRRRRTKSERRKRGNGKAAAPLHHSTSSTSSITMATPHGKSMTSFIQSAFSSSGGGGEEGEERRGRSVQGRGESAGKRSRTGKKSSSRARKRPRLSAHERGKLAAVRWPGFGEEGEEESDSEIDVYSDSSSDDREGLSEDIEEDLNQTSEMLVSLRGGEGGGGKRRPGEKSAGKTRRKQTKVGPSVPLKQKTEAVALAENIDDFESPSTEDDDVSPHPSPSSLPHTSTPAPHTRKPQINRGLPMPTPTLECAPTPEYMSISTPPSSPEIASVSDINRAKTSDWIKQVQLEPTERSRTEVTFLNDTVRTPHASDSTRKRRGRKFVPGGLAERLQRLIQHENSEVTFWEHRVKKLEDKELETSSCLTVQVLSLTNCYSLLFAKCHILEGSPMPLPQASATATTADEITHRCTMEGSREGCEERSASHIRDLKGEIGISDGTTEAVATAYSGITGETTHHLFGSHGLFVTDSESETNEHQGSLHPGDFKGDGTQQDSESDTHTLSIPPYSHGVDSELRSEEGSLVSRTLMGRLQEHGSHTPAKPLLHPPEHRILEHSRTMVITEFFHAREQSCAGEGERVTVLFSQRCARYLNLRVGNHIRIFPPWQCLCLPSLQHRVVLCTLFCQVVGHTPLESLLPPFPCKQRGVEGVFGMVSPEKAPRLSHSLLVKSPARGLKPARLFGVSPQDKEDNDSMLHEANTTIPPTRSVIRGGQGRGGGVREEPATLIDALEHAQRGVLSFTGRVVRVYRRSVPQRARPRGEEENQSLCQTFVLQAKQRSLDFRTRWVLLVCDANCVFSEIHIPEENLSLWGEVIRAGEGRAFHFSHVRVTQRTTASRNPEIFSLISSLRLETTPTRETTPTSASSPSQGDNTAAPLPVPSFCYILTCQSHSRAHCYENESKCPRLPPVVQLRSPLDVAMETTMLTPPSGGGGEVPVLSRISLLARVVHVQLEVPQETDEDGRLSLHSLHPLPSSPHTSHHHPTPRCGYFLFTLVPGPSAHQDTLRIYLKPSFAISGLQRALTKPGARVLLRDVQCERTADGRHYSMDTCSLLAPVSRLLLEPDIQFYPERNFSNDELRVLSSLTSPHLPPLSQDNARVGSLVSLSGIVVGVDEENAFSWPACDCCGNGKLGSSSYDAEDTSDLYCDECNRMVPSPVLHMQLAVFVQDPTLLGQAICVQLLQSTIRQLLPISAASIEDGFDVHCILERDISLQACYILETKDTPGGSTLYMEEVDIQLQDQEN